MIGWKRNPERAKPTSSDRVSSDCLPRRFPYRYTACVHPAIILVLAEFPGDCFETVHKGITTHPQDAYTDGRQQARDERRSRDKGSADTVQPTRNVSAVFFRRNGSWGPEQKKQKKQLAKHGEDAAA